LISFDNITLNLDDNFICMITLS